MAQEALAGIMKGCLPRRGQGVIEAKHKLPGPRRTKPRLQGPARGGEGSSDPAGIRRAVIHAEGHTAQNTREINTLS